MRYISKDIVARWTKEHDKMIPNAKNQFCLVHLIWRKAFAVERENIQLHFRDEVHIAKNGPADQWNLKVYVAREDTCLQSSVAHLVCTACCTLEQTKILAKPFRFLHLSRIALMILVFLLLLSACAACHTCEDPAFERITSTTIIEKEEVGFSGLLVILENSIRELAEKQAKMTSSMNITNIADYAVSIKRRNNGAPLSASTTRILPIQLLLIRHTTISSTLTRHHCQKVRHW